MPLITSYSSPSAMDADVRKLGQQLLETCGFSSLGFEFQQCPGPGTHNHGWLLKGQAPGKNMPWVKVTAFAENHDGLWQPQPLSINCLYDAAPTMSYLNYDTAANATASLAMRLLEMLKLEGSAFIARHLRGEDKVTWVLDSRTLPRMPSANILAIINQQGKRGWVIDPMLFHASYQPPDWFE